MTAINRMRDNPVMTGQKASCASLTELRPSVDLLTCGSGQLVGNPYLIALCQSLPVIRAQSKPGTNAERR